MNMFLTNLMYSLLIITQDSSHPTITTTVATLIALKRMEKETLMDAAKIKCSYQ